MKMKKYFGIIIILVMMLTLAIASTASAAAEKVDVCHLDKDSGAYHLINISDNAFDQHVAHGDAAPGQAVPGMQHYIFNSDCTVTYIPQKELKQTLTVYPTNVPVTSIVLASGVNYQLEASGTFYYNSAGDWADAEWYQISGVPVKGDTQGSKPYVLDISINGYAQNTDWGAYQSSHVYDKDWTGADASLTFSIYDSAYSDNSGSITVKIFQVNW